MNTITLLHCITFLLLSAGWMSSVVGTGGIIALGLLGVAKAKVAAALTGYAFGRAIRRSRGRRRFGRRSAVIDSAEEIWESVSKWDDDQCVEKLFCEIGTGALNDNIYTDIVQGLLILDPQDFKQSAMLPYINASHEGNRHRKITNCQGRYKCSSTGIDLLAAVPKYLYQSQ